MGSLEDLWLDNNVRRVFDDIVRAKSWDVRFVLTEYGLFLATETYRYYTDTDITTEKLEEPVFERKFIRWACSNKF